MISLNLQNVDKLTAKSIQKCCLESDTLFVDSSFPPLSSRLSIGKVHDQHVAWKRARYYCSYEHVLLHVCNGCCSEFMDGPYAVFEDGIEPADIRQGALSDCWLQCALAGLAEFPHLVEVSQ